MAQLKENKDKIINKKLNVNDKTKKMTEMGIDKYNEVLKKLSEN